ncbi:HotDog domain-containing protein [Astrocystis sublimbata]|nr:HotDog domain-containing protein [Astrocystis sublimbata]
MTSFDSIPWCATLLQKPGVVRFTPPSRSSAGADGRLPPQDRLFSTSLRTADTVPNYLGFYQSPFSDPVAMTLPETRSAENGQSLEFLINTLSLLMDLRPGLNGFNGTVHGGIIATVFDEAMGSLLYYNAATLREMMTKGAVIPRNILNLVEASPVFTAGMNVTFVKPIPTPQVVIVTARLVKAEGRKLVLDYDVKDGEGGVCARGEGLWVSARKDKL